MKPEMTCSHEKLSSGREGPSSTLSFVCLPLFFMQTNTEYVFEVTAYQCLPVER